MELIEAIRTIENDFINKQPPFDDVEFPEERLLDVLPHNSMEDRLRLISMFATFDYNRNANQLVNNIITLHEGNKSLFNPSHVHNGDSEMMEALFEKIGFRYPSRDSSGWQQNCTILLEHYSGKWHELLLETGCDAPDLVQQLNEDDFLYLKGDKIAPMYARIINDDVCELDNMWQLNIPVDTWVRKETQELVGEDMSDDEIRAWWGVMGEQADISRHIVDGGLWLIGNNWSEWGEEYFKEVTGIESFKYL